jgi:purine-binding chemotaxis protein CheW
MRLLLFTIDDGRYALRAEVVAEIVRAVSVTPLPNAPSVIEGIIDVRGRVVPVFDLRKRFGLPSRELDVADQFVIARAATRLAALHVDRALDLADVDDAAVTSLAAEVPSAQHITGVATMPDGLALIHDVDAFLSAAESASLDAAMSTNPSAARAG